LGMWAASQWLAGREALMGLPWRTRSSMSAGAGARGRPGCRRIACPPPVPGPSAVPPAPPPPLPPCHPPPSAPAGRSPCGPGSMASGGRLTLLSLQPVHYYTVRPLLLRSLSTPPVLSALLPVGPPADDGPATDGDGAGAPRCRGSAAAWRRCCSPAIAHRGSCCNGLLKHCMVDCVARGAGPESVRQACLTASGWDCLPDCLWQLQHGGLGQFSGSVDAPSPGPAPS
jgi:hypothetical protein